MSSADVVEATNNEQAAVKAECKMHSLGVVRVADLEKLLHKLVELVLRKSDPHVDDVICGSWRIEVPTSRDLSPGMFDLEIVPTFGDEGLSDGQ